MIENSSVNAAGAGADNLGAIFVRELPYVFVLTLAIFGVGYSSLARTPITLYWVVLAPFIGMICVLSRWRETESGAARMRLIWMQALHWLAVLAAIQLMFTAVVSRMSTTDSDSLETLTLLALGTFTAGVQIASWRICLVGVLLALGVPAIAWLEQSTLMIVLIVAVVVALAAPFVFRGRRTLIERAEQNDAREPR